MYCPNCGKEYQENQNFCRFCGVNLHNDNTNLEMPINNSESSANILNQNNTVENSKNNNPDKLVDLTINSQNTNDNNINETEKITEITQEKNDKNDENPSEDVNNFFTDIKNSLIIETSEGKKLTPSAITLLVVLFVFIVFMGNILWSINDAIQINPSMTNENALINIPNDNENGTYTKSPEPIEEKFSEKEEQQQELQEEYKNEQLQQIEESTVIPTEEIKQREQQFPEPEIPEPQEINTNDEVY